MMKNASLNCSVLTLRSFGAFIWYCLLGASSSLAFAAADVNAPADLIALDIANASYPKVQALRAQAPVLWSAELGTELLLAVEDPNQTQTLLQQLKNHGNNSARLLPMRASRSEIVLQSLNCGGAPDVHVSTTKINVGGFALAKLPAEQIPMTLLLDPSLRALASVAEVKPRHLVIAQTLANLATPITPPPVRPNVSQLVARVNADRWFTNMSSLAAFNRNSFNTLLLNSRDWIRDRFIDAGLTTSDYVFPLSSTSCVPTPPVINIPNIIGRKPGVIDEWIVVGAHFDSRNTERCDFSTNPQPGANDNASGCAGVIELANVFKDVSTQRGILFMCFSGEEQGLRGSVHYVNSLINSGDISKIKGMINLDMIGHDMDGSLPTRIDTRSPFSALAQQFAGAAATYAPELRIIISLNNDPNTDHLPFLNANIPAVHTWENGASGYAAYHSVDDLPSAMTRPKEMAGGILKMDTAVLADLAMLIDDRFFADAFE